MGYKWLTLTYDFDRSLPISKIRYTVDSTRTGDSNGYFSELPNINTDGRTWSSSTGATWGYATENRFNMGKNYFSNHYYNFTNEYWTATTHTTLVSGNTYEFDCPVTLYYSGLQNYNVTTAQTWLSYSYLVYVQTIGISIDTDSLSFDATGGTNTVDISSENPWTATTTDNWITIAPISGLSDATVTISTPYNSFGQRTGTVTFTDGEDTIDLTVYQKGNTLIPFKKMYKNGNRIN